MKYLKLFILVVFYSLNVSVKAEETDSLYAQMSDSAIVNLLENNGVIFTHNNRLTLLPSGKEKFKDMFEAIRQAKSSIHLEYFNFRNDSIANELFALLAYKAKQGVEIRALFDAFGNYSNDSPLLKEHILKLREEGIQIYEFDPLKFPYVNHIFARDHRKIVVIDGSVAYTGGMNVADYYINGTDVVGEWRDMHCRIEGGAVNQLQMIFIRMWEKVTGEDIWKQQYFNAYYPEHYERLSPDTTITAGNKTIGIINREPRTTNKIIRTYYLGAINMANDSIRIINPYLTLNRKLKKALKNAIKRGVKVEIMVSARCDIPFTPDCVYFNVHKLMKEGACVWLYLPGFHHSKIMTIDGRSCTIGSVNLDARSLNMDYEENAVIIDIPTTKQLDEIFDRDKEKSTKLTNESWNAFRTPYQKFKGWFANLLSPFL